MGQVLVTVGLLLGAGVVMWILVSNGLIRRRHQAENAYSQVDVQLRRKVSLIPNLLEAVKGYAAHEKQLLTAIAEARSALVSARRPQDAARANHQLTQSLGALFLAVAENYPQLKADSQFARLQEELVSTENRVSYARQAYNDAVMAYNIAIESIPGSLVAGGRHRAMSLFALPEESRSRADDLQITF